MRLGGAGMAGPADAGGPAELTRPGDFLRHLMYSCGAFPRGGRATLGPWGVSVRVPPGLLCTGGFGSQFGTRPGGPCQGIWVLEGVSVVVHFLVRAPSIGAGHFPPGREGSWGVASARPSDLGPVVLGSLRLSLCGAFVWLVRLSCGAARAAA